MRATSGGNCTYFGVNCKAHRCRPAYGAPPSCHGHTPAWTHLLHEESMVKNAPPSAGEVRALAQQLMSWADMLAAGPQINRVLADADRHELVLALATAARA